VKGVAFNSNDALNKKLNDFIDRTNSKIGQLNSVIDLLIKENQELKAVVSNQRFIIQPVNPFHQGSQSSQAQTAQITNPAQSALALPLADSFLPTNGITSTGADQRSQHATQHQEQQQSQQQAQQQQHNAHSQHQQQHSQQQTHHHHQSQANGVLDGALAETSTNSGMLRFINNQYVDDDQNLNNQASGSNNPNSRIDFVFMDPSANRSRHYRSNSANFQDASGDEDNSPMSQMTPPQSNSRLQKSTTRQGEYSAENYDLIIHNDFNKVEDIYYEYYNSLKPQVERVQKAYKIKKIRKYQKIKALAVRIDRYKEVKGCSLAESFQFFDNLRLAEDNTKRSIAWLYNTLPDILKKIGLEDQLKRNPGA
jgi:hypothetical protein